MASLGTMPKAKKRPGPLERFGQRVRDLRIHLDLSQEELAAEADMHWTYVGQVERGKRNVTLLTMIQLAGALGVEPAALLAPALPEGVEEAPPGKVRPGGRRRPPKPRGRGAG